MTPRGDYFCGFKPAALLRGTGEDAFGFLQGQFTNDLRPPPGSAIYGLWLNQKGKVLADSMVIRLAENEFLLVSGNSPAAGIKQRLEEYIVADDVVLVDETASAHGLVLWGPDSSGVVRNLLGETPGAGRFIRSEGAVVFGGRRLPGANYEIVGPANTLAEFRRHILACGGEEVTAVEMEFTRISAGIPAVPVDVGPGDLPNEGGLEDTALSHTKGCYLGQEVMARLKNLGQVRRRLHTVRGRGPAPTPLAALYQGEKKLGEVRSVADRAGEFAALAMLSLVNLNPEAGLSLAPGGPAVITLDRHG